MDISNKVGGEYKLSIKKPDGSIVETEWFDNLILNNGMDALGAPFNPIQFCRVGTGTSAPLEAQTSLDAQIASSPQGSGAQTAVNQGVPTYACVYVYAWTFTQGSVVGNISEIGVGWGSGPNGSLFSRALITDNNGNPITITLIAIDQLTVFYKLTITPNKELSFGTVSINNVVYNYSSTLAEANSYGSSTSAMHQGFAQPSTADFYAAGATLGPITGRPIGTSNSGYSIFNNSQNGTVSNQAYANGSYFIDANWSFGINIGNHTGGIGAILFGFGWYAPYKYQIRFDNLPVPKLNTMTFQLTTRYRWSR